MINKDEENHMKHQRLYIIVASLCVITGLYVCDQIFELTYLMKIGIKLILFFAFPLYYMIKTNRNFFWESLKKREPLLRLNLSHILGLLIVGVLIITYFIVKPTINVSIFQNELELKYKITQENIFLYGFYMTFINSLLEEFFFRGFMFLELKKLNMKKNAYFISSIAFSIYHISNFQNWFSFGIMLLAIVGLFIGGLIFDYLDDRQNSFFNSWFVHICADIAIVWIGYDLLITS